MYTGTVGVVVVVVVVREVGVTESVATAARVVVTLSLELGLSTGVVVEVEAPPGNKSEGESENMAPLLSCGDRTFGTKSVVLVLVLEVGAGILKGMPTKPNPSGLSSVPWVLAMAAEAIKATAARA